MGTLILLAVGLVAAAAAAVALRHIFLKVSRPKGFECSLRVRSGDVPGLTHRFRAGYAGREMESFVWRRMAWPSPPVRFPATAVRLDQEWAPSVRDHVFSVPATFSVVVVELEGDVRLELALPRRKMQRIIAALGS